MGIALEKPLGAHSYLELIELRKVCLFKMANSLSRLIMREIDQQGTKKRVRTWLRTLREVRDELSESKGLSDEMLVIIYGRIK